MPTLIALHGRGATSHDILPLAQMLAGPGWEIVTPQAAGGTWYPYSFMAHTEANEPAFSLAMAQLATIHKELNAAGVPDAQIYFTGFSQGGCLALTYAQRFARRWGGIAAFSAGLIGPEGTTWPIVSFFEQTPVYLSCDSADPHIPAARFEESALVLANQGAAVTSELIKGLGHTIAHKQVSAARLCWGL
jgi:predicted esterase